MTATSQGARKVWDQSVRAWSRDDCADVVKTMKLGEAMMYAATDLICALEDDGWRTIDSAPVGEAVDVWRDAERLTDYVFDGSRWSKKVGYPAMTNVLTKPPTHWRLVPGGPMGTPLAGEADADDPHAECDRCGDEHPVSMMDEGLCPSCGDADETAEGAEQS